MKKILNILACLCVFAISNFAVASYGGISYSYRTNSEYDCSYNVDGIKIGDGKYSINSLIGTKKGQIVSFDYFGKHQIGDSFKAPQPLLEAFQKRGLDVRYNDSLTRANTEFIKIFKTPLISEPVFNLELVISGLNRTGVTNDGQFAAGSDPYLYHSTHLEFDNSTKNLFVELNYSYKNAFTGDKKALLRVDGSCSLAK